MLLNVFSLKSQMEEYPCGVSSDVDVSMVQSIVDAMPDQGSVATTGSTFDIPINVIFLVDDTGIMPFNLNEGSALAGINASIEHTNEHFTGNYSFYLCSYSIVTAPDDIINDFRIGNENQWSTAYALSHSDEAINWYITNTFNDDAGLALGGAARFPWNPFPNNMIVSRYQIATFQSTEIGGNHLSHELGHYYGLLHTFNNAPQDPATACEISGDRICQTPPDLGTLLSQSCNNNCVEETCTWTINTSPSIIWEYNPDKSNLMSYYPCTDKIFVEEQEDVMTTFLFNHPDRHFVFANPQNLDCITIPYPEGFIFHPQVSFAGDESYSPVTSTGVEFIFNGLCNPATSLDGYFEMQSCGLTPNTGDISYGVKYSLGDNEWDYYLNGVTTFDVVLVNRHILGTDPFTSPFEYIAADVNNSGTVTTFDAIKIRKLILGIDSEFSVNSWRYVPAVTEEDAQFWNDFNANPLDPALSWDAPDMTSRTYLAANGNKSYLDYIDLNTNNTIVADERVWSFYAVKSGDINGSAVTSPNGISEDDENTFVFTETKESAELLANGITTNEFLVASISVGSNENIDLSGYQFSVHFDDYYLELVAVEPGDLAFSSEDFVVDYSGNGAMIKTLWANLKIEPITVTENDKLFVLLFRPKHNLTDLTNMISFGGYNGFKDLIIADDGKMSNISLQANYTKADEKDFIIKEAYGNPFSSSGDLHIKIDMKEVKDVELILQDNFGHTIFLNYNNLILGENNIDIPANMVSILQNGTIFYTIATDEQVRTGTVVKMY